MCYDANCVSHELLWTVATITCAATQDDDIFLDRVISNGPLSADHCKIRYRNIIFFSLKKCIPRFHSFRRAFVKYYSHTVNYLRLKN